MSDRFFELIDTHVHFDMDDFDADRDALAARSSLGEFPSIVDTSGQMADIRLVAAIDPGITAASSVRAVELTRKYSFLYAAAAIHPNYTAEAQESDWKILKSLVTEPKVVAVGETGLDRYWDDSPFETQKAWFLRHIELAKQYDLPIIIHCREAIDDLLPILRQVREQERLGQSVGKPLRGTIHSFSEGPEAARELVSMGFYLGFTGSVTYTQKKFAPLWEAARSIPLDRFLLETDSPFLIPHPFRGKIERNEPLMCTFVARRLAELRSATVGEILQRSTANARRLFTRIAPCADSGDGELDHD